MLLFLDYDMAVIIKYKLKYIILIKLLISEATLLPFFFSLPLITLLEKKKKKKNKIKKKKEREREKEGEEKKAFAYCYSGCQMGQVLLLQTLPVYEAATPFLPPASVGLADRYISRICSIRKIVYVVSCVG